MARSAVECVGEKANGDRAAAVVFDGVAGKSIATEEAASAVVPAALPAYARAPAVPDGAKDGGRHSECYKCCETLQVGQAALSLPACVRCLTVGSTMGLWCGGLWFKVLEFVAGPIGRVGRGVFEEPVVS